MLVVSWLVLVAFWMSCVHCIHQPVKDLVNSVLQGGELSFSSGLYADKLFNISGETCDFSNEDCTTKGAINTYGSFVNGIDDIVEASDPLRLDVFEDTLPTLQYKLSNASLTGMKECVVETLRVDKEALTFLFVLECPHIVAKSDYEIKGKILSMFVEGKGVLTITCVDYALMFNCKYEKKLGQDGKTYVHIKSHSLDAEPRGKVMFEMTNLFNGDKEKSEYVHNFLNRNWRIIDGLFRSPSLDKYMELFVNNLNRFLKANPVENVLPKKNES